MLMSNYTNFVFKSIATVDEDKTFFFIIPQILINFLFRGVLVAIIFYIYNQKLTELVSDNGINIFKAILFCNNSLDKKPKNRRAKKQKENEEL